MAKRWCPEDLCFERFPEDAKAADVTCPDEPCALRNELRRAEAQAARQADPRWGENIPSLRRMAAKSRGGR